MDAEAHTTTLKKSWRWRLMFLACGAIVADWLWDAVILHRRPKADKSAAYARVVDRVVGGNISQALVGNDLPARYVNHCI